MISKILIKIIKLYQMIFSKYSSGKCRFYPTCSQYSILCLSKYNFFKAILLIIIRIIKCNPLGPRGYDPV